MADKKAPTSTANKAAMSRALGAAFLNHQVEQLEKSVASNGNSNNSSNWRDRKNVNGYRPISPNAPKRGPIQNSGPGVGGKMPPRKNFNSKGGGEVKEERGGPKRRSHEEERSCKDADLIVVDASVLIHALYQVKKWCRDGREEVLIVPLEALNTLDLLKKGTSSLAQKARAASRILEAQVGTNPRIRVQRDDAFVLWDKIIFQGDTTNCPEWVRRIICCAQWEAEHPEEELKLTITTSAPMNNRIDVPVLASPKPRVVLATLSAPPSLSPKVADLSITDDVNAPLTPVPLPAPTVPHSARYEARSTGTLVASWASKAGIKIFEVEPARGPASAPAAGGGDGDDMDNRKRSHGHGHGHRRPSTSEHQHPHVQKSGAGLVERPPAVMAMMEMISQPSKVVRVLARGEKLDPDP